MDEKKIFTIIENRNDDLIYKKAQIELFFRSHPDEAERAEYLRSAYQDRFTEIIADGARLGYRPQENGLLMWEGAYLSRTSESVFSWKLVAGFTAQLIDRREYYINTEIKPFVPMESQQLTLFDMPAFDQPDGTPAAPLFSHPKLPQQIIDEALCVGANDEHSRLIICAYFMKDKPDNAAFLQKHYGENGAGFYFDGEKISLWYDAEGMRIARGSMAQRSNATLISWEEAAKRIRELLELGRYMPQSELDEVDHYERMQLADSIAYTSRDMTAEARNAGFLPLAMLARSVKGGYPETQKQIYELLCSPDTLQKCVDEWTAFNAALDAGQDLLRFRFYRPKEILERLRDLQREPLHFTVADGFAPDRQFFISADEVDKVLRGGEHSTDYRLGVYAFYATHKDKAERENYLKNYHGEYSGSHTGNDNLTHTRGKGIEFSHGSISAPYAKVTLKWPEAAKRIGEMISQSRFLSKADRAAMPKYEQERLARQIVSFFMDTPEDVVRPFSQNAIADYWECVKTVAAQLPDADRVQEIYQNMLPAWESTKEDDRHYTLRKQGLEAVRAYLDGTYSVFGLEKPLQMPTTEAISELPAAEAEVSEPEPPIAEAETSEIEPALPAEEKAVLTAPQPKREHIRFAPLYPEIPAEQRHDFHITDRELGVGSKAEKYAANVAAIRTLQTVESENRLATPQEQEILSRYVGWGGIADCFDEKHSRYAELKALLTEKEYAAARASSLTAFYTSPIIIDAIYKALTQMGLESGNLLEPACGVGNFIGMLPDSMNACKTYGVELDSVSGRIARQLYQNSRIAVTGYEKAEIPDSFFDAAVGNVPFGNFKVVDRRYDKYHWLIHDYFFGKTLDKVRPGGVIAFITSKGTMDKEDLSIPADPNVRNYSFTTVDGKLYFRIDSRMEPVELPLTTENRVRGMIALRDCTRQLIEYQAENHPDEIIRREQEKLNGLYDAYVKKYGRLYTRGNNLAFSDDSSYPLLCSLEVLDNEGNFFRKADMFTKRTIRPHEPVTQVDTASEALAVSLSEKAGVDLGFMSELSGKSEDELVQELEGVIYRNIRCGLTPEEISPAQLDLTAYPYVTAEEFLSGNVRKKLRMLQALQAALPAEKKDALAGYLTAMEAIQPTELTAAEIGVRIGASWVPAEVYQQFMFELFGTSVYARQKMRVVRSEYSGEWNISNKSTDGGNIKAVTTYGTKRITAYHILEQTLNQRVVKVFDTVVEDGKERPVLNVKETAIAQDRQELIKSKFADWLWQDIDRRERLCRIYNDTFNSIRPREYDGSHIRFVGMNPEISLRKHQVNAIAHVLYGGNTLLAHEVGAGKTFEMVAAAMEMKRLGLCTKSLIVVPNHITEQWAAEWLQLYPAANILVATERDFEKRNRRRLCARIATGDYDAIIIGHSQLMKIHLSRERQQAILQRQIDEVLLAISDAKQQKAENFTIKQMERTRKSLEARLEKLNDQSTKDDTVTFEELGIDRLFIDESHNFKNLFLMTKMHNIGGIAQVEAQKSSDLFAKCQYLDELTDSHGVIFATGTPNASPYQH